MSVLIVEDDLPAQRRLVRLLRTHPAYVDATVHCADTSLEAQRLLHTGSVTLLLLDLDLHGDDGFAVLRTGGRPLAVIVVSAHAQRAIEAYELGVVDFVRKPVSEARLMLALGRVHPDAADRRPAELLVRTHAGLERVAVQDIVHVQGADDYVQITTRAGQRLLHDEPLASLERRLPADFVRVHRSHLVRRDVVHRVLELPAGRRVLQLLDGSRVPVSRRRAVTVLHQLFAP